MDLLVDLRGIPPCDSLIMEDAYDGFGGGRVVALDRSREARNTTGAALGRLQIQSNFSNMNACSAHMRSRST